MRRTSASYHALFVATLLSLISGCGEPPFDEQAALDRSIETEWPQKFDSLDAVPFFQNGGHYADTGAEDQKPLDKFYVLPVLQRLAREFGLQWKVFVPKTDSTMALAIAARLPNRETIRPEIEAALEREQATFPGAICQQWGHRWIELDFLNEEQAEFASEIEVED